MEQPTDVELTYECLEPSCGFQVSVTGEDELVAVVQRHMADAHDTFELEDVIIDGARSGGAPEGTRSA